MRKTNRLGCLTGAGLLAALITSLVIVGFAYARGGLLYNPGPLNAQPGARLGGVTSHAGIGGNCKACHTAPWEAATMADRCFACHTTIETQMRDVASMHGKMEHDNPDLTCRHCHPDHRGLDSQLTVMDSGLFPHEVVGFSLNGHQRTALNAPFTCDDCHHGDITAFASGTCQTCHRQLDVSFTQAHQLAFGADCLNCHDGVDRYGKTFNHNKFAFQLTGGHSAANCTDCHLDARTVADLQSVSQDCVSCHRKAHLITISTGCPTCGINRASMLSYDASIIGCIHAYMCSYRIVLPEPTLTRGTYSAVLIIVLMDDHRITRRRKDAQHSEHGD